MARNAFRGESWKGGSSGSKSNKEEQIKKIIPRTHGFRTRMRITSSRATIKRRRAKGHWNLCPKSNPSSGKRV